MLPTEENTRKIIDFKNYLIYTPQTYFLPYSHTIKGGNRREKPVRRRTEDLAEEFGSTLSNIIQKPLRDDKEAYYVIEFQSAPLSSRYERILNGINIDLVAFFDKEQKIALVKSDYTVDKGRLTKESGDVIKVIRERTSSEIIDDSLKKTKSNQYVMINTIPNVPVEKIIDYTSKIKEYVLGRGGEEVNELIDRENRRGSVVALTNGSVLEQLVKDSAITLSAYKVPEMIMSIIKEKRRKKTVEQSYGLIASSLDETKTADREYDIIEVDSGTRILQEFQGKVSATSALPLFANGDDVDNHGTPIASLLLFGEVNGNYSSPFTINSYKAYEGNNPQLRNQDLYLAITNALNHYQGKSKVVTSSINFSEHNYGTGYETRKIELLIQSKNICFVNSAGNINDGLSQIQDEVPREFLWGGNSVQHPSDATTITSVGSFSRLGQSDTGEDITVPSCFSRCGSDKVILKPEVLEYGGNYIADGAQNDLGVSVLGLNGLENKHGTSMAAPLFARNLASIARSIEGSSLQNAETIKAIAYSACRPTTNFKEYSGLGVFDPKELQDRNDVVHIVFEGEFTGITDDRRPVHELSIWIPVQPVEATLIVVHSDNYQLPTTVGNYTSITVESKKGQQKLRDKRGAVQLRGLSHVRKETFSYQKNSIGLWEFRLAPNARNIPVTELSNLKIRYGAILVIKATGMLPLPHATLKSAILEEMGKLPTIGKSIRQ